MAELVHPWFNGRWGTIVFGLSLAVYALIHGGINFNEAALSASVWLETELQVARLWTVSSITFAVLLPTLLAVLAFNNLRSLWIFPIWLAAYLLFNTALHLLLLACLAWWYFRSNETSSPNT